MGKEVEAEVILSREYLIDVLKVCDEIAFPNIRVLVQQALTFSITLCESERSFSQLKLIKTSHRSTMTEDRLSVLSLMKINQTRLEKLHTSNNMGHLVKRLYQLHPRRMKLEFMLSDGLKTLNGIIYFIMHLAYVEKFISM